MTEQKIATAREKQSLCNRVATGALSFMVVSATLLSAGVVSLMYVIDKKHNPDIDADEYLAYWGFGSMNDYL